MFSMRRILDEATAKASSETNLHTQYSMFSGEEFESPSAVLNRACITSPPKLWHSLSNTWHQRNTYCFSLDLNFIDRTAENPDTT